MRLHLTAATLILAGLAVPAAQAHHGWSSYDANKTLTIEAPLAAIRWANPHGSAIVTWQGQQWAVVLAPITRMEERGLTAEMLKTGRPVTLVGQPRSDGTREIKIQKIVVADKSYNLLR